MNKEAYCCWYDKFIQDFTEQESASCISKDFDFCEACDFFAFQERVVLDECRTD